GLTTEIRPLPVDEFLAADEGFLSTSGGGVAPLTRVDDRIFCSGAIGPVASAIHQTYWRWIHDPAHRSEISYS
ncbi:MAG: branched-chain amino acid--2-keto-4-methylthiobutyrate aminotransferase, partial [Pseudomonadota bacterium]|nr:branched-chain amino acid--2-keto-4-methylthiobutyrate aminotransferase [Pseudomonadota bacterium]